MISVTLPWPPKELSPNARVHWSKRSKAAKAYRAECGWQVKAHCTIGQLFDLTMKEGKLNLWLEFVPPDRRHRDDDNMVAAFKAGRDGIADAMGIDDKRFNCHWTVSEEIGGMVRVRVTK